MDEHALQNAKVLLDSASIQGSLLTAIDHRLSNTLGNADNLGGSTTRPWRVLVRDAVQAIIEPHVLDWMDDDDTLTDHDFVIRALTEVDARFAEQWVDPSKCVELSGDVFSPAQFGTRLRPPSKPWPRTLERYLAY